MKSIQEIEAGLELDSDEEILRAQLDTASARIAELERVQGVLVGALEAIQHSMKQAKIIGNDWRRELNLSEETARTALAAAQKPSTCDKCNSPDLCKQYGRACEHGEAQKPEGGA